jgi:hypothetical protein
MTDRGEANGTETWAAELPKRLTRPVQNSVDNAKRRVAYGPMRRLCSGCPEADRLPDAFPLKPESHAEPSAGRRV